MRQLPEIVNGPKMAKKKQLILLTCLFFLISPSEGFIDSLYCGRDNCYDLLDVDRDATKNEITKAYRKMAKKWHPDMHRKKEDKESASEMFTKIATAYETLKDEESRRDYDYMLDNPEEVYQHYFYYYRRRMAPKVDVRIVIAVSITVISVIQYWSAWNNYNTALSYLITVPKYRIKATEIAKSDGLIGNKKKRDRSKTKEELKLEEEAILKQVLAEKMDIRGGYSKPTVFDILWIQLVLSPYFLLRYLGWHARWIWKFTIKGEEYGEEEKEYIIRRNMKLKQGQWDSLEEHERDGFLAKKLWIKANFSEWKTQKEENMKAELAGNNKYKMYRRYMKKGGAGQMSFGPE